MSNLIKEKRKGRIQREMDEKRRRKREKEADKERAALMHSNSLPTIDRDAVTLFLPLVFKYSKLIIRDIRVIMSHAVIAKNKRINKILKSSSIMRTKNSNLI